MTKAAAPKYDLLLRSRVSKDDEHTAKHERLKLALNKIGGDWGIDGTKWPAIPPMGSGLSESVPLSKCLQKGIKGRVVYAFRGTAGDEQSMYDDWVSLTFQCTPQRFKDLSDHAFGQWVKAFNAYIGYVGCYELAAELNRLKSPENEQERAYAWHHAAELKRAGVYWIHALNFWDAELCRKAFGLSTQQVAERLKPHVSKVEEFSGGVLVATTRDVISLEEARLLQKKLRPLLP